MSITSTGEPGQNNPEPNTNIITSQPPAASASALVVDDNFYNRDIVRIALQSQGFEVTDIEDPVAAVSLLDKRTFDLLVLDLQMPILDGRHVLRHIRPDPSHRAMKIIVLTAHSQMDTLEVQENADYIMYKPIDVLQFAQFAHRIQSARNKRSAKAPDS